MRIFSVYSYSSPCKASFPRFIVKGFREVDIPNIMQLVRDKAESIQETCLQSLVRSHIHVCHISTDCADVDKTSALHTAW